MSSQYKYLLAKLVATDNPVILAKKTLILLILSAIIMAISPYCYATEVENNIPYNINLMWINKKKPVSAQDYIFPEKKHFATIEEWVERNPGITVNLWYDRKYTHESSIVNTEKEIAHKKYKNSVVLKNIRELKEVIKNPDVFSDKLPIYFRADLLRVVASLHEVSQNNLYFIYADLDVQPMGKEQLFTSVAKSWLRKFGIVLGRDPGGFSYENQFFIMNSSNKHLLEAVQLTIIDLNIKRALWALENGYFLHQYGKKVPEDPYKPIEEVVYQSYQNMFKYFYWLLDIGSLTNTITKEPYKKEDGLEPFGIKQLIDMPFYSTKGALDHEKKLKYPLMDIKAPPPIPKYHQK